jgi:3-oxoacyl-[acyl-carrier-protein] synthase III
MRIIKKFIKVIINFIDYILPNKIPKMTISDKEVEENIKEYIKMFEKNREHIDSLVVPTPNKEIIKSIKNNIKIQDILEKEKKQ